jgi:hypothetical protein
MPIQIPRTPRDKNFHSFDKEIGKQFHDRVFAPERPQDWDDILKISACRDCVFDHIQVRSTDPCNREDGVDISYLCDGVTLKNFFVDAGGLYGVTIKQARNILLQNGTIGRPGGGWERVDIDLGSRSQYRRLRTQAVTIDNVHRLDGEPVRVRVGDADWPELHNGVYDILHVQSVGLKCFVWALARIDARTRGDFKMLDWSQITEEFYA